MYLEPNVHSTDAKIKMDIMSKENLCGEEKKKKTVEIRASTSTEEKIDGRNNRRISPGTLQLMGKVLQNWNLVLLTLSLYTDL